MLGTIVSFQLRFNRSKSQSHILYRGRKIFNSTPQLLDNNKSLRAVRTSSINFTVTNINSEPSLSC